MMRDKEHDPPDFKVWPYMLAVVLAMLVVMAWGACVPTVGS